MRLPPRANKYLSLTVALCTVPAITACVASPSKQNNQLSSPANKNNSSNSNYSSAPVDVSDLNNSNESDAVQQLRTRGFNQVGAKPASSTGISQSWWLNLPANQCFQLDMANHKVMSIAPKSSQDCHNTR